MQRCFVSVVVLVLGGLMLSGCASVGSTLGQPIYFTESGVGHQFEELGPVVGSVFGWCYSDESVFNAACVKALEKARSMGADAILIPNSLSSSGLKKTSECYWSLQILTGGMCPGGFGDVQALAIKFKDKESLNDPEIKNMISSGEMMLCE